MGYTQDKVIAPLFADLNLHKHFPHVQATVHKIHQHVAQSAIVIPLWQLGTYVALSPSVRPKDRAGNPVALNRFDLFGGVEHWELEVEPLP